jgi:hypothetical protein
VKTVALRTRQIADKLNPSVKTIERATQNRGLPYGSPGGRWLSSNAVLTLERY